MAARARRSKLSARSMTAFLAPGSVNCSSHLASLLGIVEPFQSLTDDRHPGAPSPRKVGSPLGHTFGVTITAILRPTRRQPARSRPKARETEARL
jgi:hypothetical protein